MKKIEAMIRREKVADVREALANVGITGMTILEAQGAGQEQGHVQIYRGTEYLIDTSPKVKLEIIIAKQHVQPCLDCIANAARTGAIGDGKIIVTPVEQILNIRTGD